MPRWTPLPRRPATAACRSAARVVVACVALAAGTATAQVPYDTYTGWAVDTTPVLPAEERHPSLWFTSDEVEALRARRSADPHAESVWAVVAQEINRYRGMALEQTTPNNRPIMAKLLALAWVLDGDAQARDKAIGALLAAYDGVPRTVVPGPGDFRLIFRATWLQNFLAAYDWLHPVLTPAQEADIRARLIEEAQLIRDNLVEGARYSPRPHNHRSKPAWALASAALTLSDHDQAADWLQHALEQSNTVTRYQFSYDGIYREGGHYHVYNLVNLIPFLWHYRNVSGVDLFPDFQPAFEWPLRIRMNRGAMPNIEDGFIKPMPLHMVAAAYTDTPTDLHSTASLGELFQWHWQATNVVPRNYSGATNDIVWEAVEFLAYDPAIPSAEPDASPTVRVESGQVAFRNTWTYGDPESRYLLFHGVASGDNHNHPDNLSYFIEAHGALLAVDAGYGPDGFSDPARAWYTSPEAHNIVTMFGSGPADWDWNEGPTTTHFLDTPFYDFAEMEAPLYAEGSLSRRGIAFPNERFWVVYDLLESPFEADFHLNVHGRSTRARDFSVDGNRVTWTTPATWGPSARLHAYLLASEPSAEIETKAGQTSLMWGHSETQHYVRMGQRGERVGYLHLLYPGRAATPFPEVNDLSGDGVLAFEVVDGDARSQFVLNRTGGEAAVGGITTTAQFAWAEHDQGVLGRFAVTRGGHLGWGGEPVVQSDVPLTLAGEAAGGALRRLFLEAPDEPAAVRVWPGSRQAFDAVTFNGVAMPYDALEDGSVRVALSAGGALAFETITSAEGRGPGQEGLRIDAVYPNPSAGRVHVRYEVAEAGPVSVRIFNVLGQLVHTVTEGVHAPGSYEVRWDAAALGAASGLYLVEVRAAAASARTPFVLQR